MGTEAANKAFSAYVGLDNKPEKKSKAKAKDDAAGEATEVERSDHPGADTPAE